MRSRPSPELQPQVTAKITFLAKREVGSQSRLPSAGWMTAGEAAAYLRVSSQTFQALLIDDRLGAFRSPDERVLFRCQDLDAVLVPVSGSEAARLVSSPDHKEKTSSMASSTSSEGQPDDFMPLQHAAKALGNIKYKTLLALVQRGEVPANNIGAKGKRPRYMVSLSLVRAALISQAEHETAMRRAPPRVNLSRFVRSGGRDA